MTKVSQHDEMERRHVRAIGQTDDVQVTRIGESWELPHAAPTVMLFVNGTFFGGGQRVVLDLFKRLPQFYSGDVILCSLGQPCSAEIFRNSVAVIQYDGQYNSPRTLVSASRHLRQLLAERRVGILHTHGIDADLIGGLAVIGSSRSQVCHFHTMPRKNARASFGQVARRELFRALTHRGRASFVAVSAAVKREMADFYRLPSARIHTVLNGIDVAQFSGCRQARTLPRFRPRTSLLLGTACRLAPMKGLDHLIRAVSEVRASGIECRLRIAGIGSERRRLEKMADDLDVCGAIEFCGHVENPIELYREIDVFVLPSLDEGLPLVLLEAMASSVSVIATRVGGVEEAIEHGRDGIVVSPGSSRELADAIRSLAAREEFRRALAVAGCRRAEREFDVGRMASEVAAVYRESAARGWTA